MFLLVCSTNAFCVTADELKKLEESAKQGDAQAQNRLGLCYGNGDGVKKDPKMAFLCFEKAAKQGYAKAQFNLGTYYREGIGVEKDSKMTFLWFEKRYAYSYSIEIIGQSGNYQTLQVTDLSMDKGHDCKRVTAPTQLSPCQIYQFEETAVAVAEEIDLKGIMDVEVILHDNQLKLLEIDARLPSQTPISVYWSTGVNMIKMLCELFLNEKTDGPQNHQKCFVCVEHIRVRGNVLEVCGERVMSSDTPLTLQPCFFGADEALTSYQPKKRTWVATMIFAGNSHGEISAKKKSCYEEITNL